MTNPDTILCADWSGSLDKRALWEANVRTRHVRRVPTARGWTLDAIVALATRSPGATLVTIDAPIGLPASYVAASRAPGFLSLLTQRTADWLDAICWPTPWTVAHPFFGVPPFKGGIKGVEQQAAALGVALRRAIERATKGKSVFIKSGIPGSVGTAACELWKELRPQVACGAVSAWPFQGTLSELLVPERPVVAEIYPRAAYATALLPGTPATRPPLTIAKTQSQERNEAIDRLTRVPWLTELGVTLDHLHAARDDEDDFDACLTACALLRTVLEQQPLYAAAYVDPVAEGGILGTGTVNLGLRERSLGGAPRSTAPFTQAP